jgi:peptidoglycan hydrolase-like protein with peptidoglycan-binding domain
MTSRPPRSTDARPWLPAIAAGLVLAMVIGVGVFLGGNGTNVGAEPSTLGTTPATDRNGIIAPVATTTPPGIAPTAPPLAAPISLGSAGEDVRRVQERLTQLGFQPGPADGQFGTGTQQAVWAFKKLVGNVAWEDFAARDDQTVVTDDVWQQMADPSVRFLPRRPGSGTNVEIYLPLQVMAVFRDDLPIFISHISSGELRPDGEPATFCETATYDTDENGNTYPEPVTKQVCAEAKSPGGVFSLRRYHDGNRVSPLGGMKNPWYFNYGIAIHGAQNVPTRPASHGCIRISNSLADVFPDLVERGDAVYVWGHDGKEPEQYSERESLPSFNRPDPNATTTTTSTTTTTTTTTVPPATTAPPTTAATPTTVATTQPPASTTPSTTTTIVP